MPALRWCGNGWPGPDWYYVDAPAGQSTPEGTRHEWLAVLEAIEQRKTRCFAGARLAVAQDALDGFLLWSPRNANPLSLDYVRVEEADAMPFVAAARVTLGAV